MSDKPFATPPAPNPAAAGRSIARDMRLGHWLLVGGGALAAWAGVAAYRSARPMSQDARDPVLDAVDLEDDPPLAAPPFDPAIVDTRPAVDGLRINDSAATFRTSCPAGDDSEDAWLDELHASYAACVRANGGRAEILPSMNAIDGKAKQFDDGLVAAIEQASFATPLGRLPSRVELVRRAVAAIGPDSRAAPFLAAGLSLAGDDVPVRDEEKKRALVAKFLADEASSKPISFYGWTETLSRSFRFMRFLQQDFDGSDDVAAAIAADPALRADYEASVRYHARLSNPFTTRPLADLPGSHVADAKGAAFFPASSSPESALFERLFTDQLPPGTNLMAELIRRIRSGEVDLTPRPGAGWYDHQIHALETLLLTANSEEHAKVALDRSYKRRLLAAFAALLTKRRETHAEAHGRGLLALGDGGGPPPPRFRPRLRLEPCLSYHLRTARAYAFVAGLLDAAVGPEALREIHGLREGGERPADLRTELDAMRDLFYGFYLVSCEDVGRRPEFAPGEPVDAERCRAAALAWLGGAFDDPDLAVDTRVSIPIAFDVQRETSRLWATLGVRLVKLRVRYGHAPSVRREGGDDASWREVDASALGDAWYLLPVDEFAEIRLPADRALTREEFRAVCDRERTRTAIEDALAR